jgi:hypothetical protein
VVVVEDTRMGEDPKQSNNEDVVKQATGTNTATNNIDNENKENDGRKKSYPSCGLYTHRRATSKACAMNPQTVQKCKQKGELSFFFETLQHVCF